MRAPALLLQAIGAAAALLASAACGASEGATADATTRAPQPVVAPDDADAIPCAPRRVLRRICQQCYTNPTQSGAPFPLVNRSDIVRIGPDGEIRRLMIEQIEAGRMPLAPVTIDYDSREVLLDWLTAGAPHDCAPTTDASAD